MILKVFTQPNCAKCPPAKALGRQLSGQDTSEVKNTPGVKLGQNRENTPAGVELKIEYFDTSTVDGLAEASFYSVMATPSLILCDDSGKEIKSWRGKVPSKNAILVKLKSKK